VSFGIATAGLTVGLGALALAGLSALALEVQYRRRLGNKLALTTGRWHLDVYEPKHYLLVGELEFHNQTQRLEIMVPEVSGTVTLLAGGQVETVQTQVRLIPCHEDAKAREDGYWEAYIVKVGQRDRLRVEIDIQGPSLARLDLAWVQIQYVTYGPGGRIPKTQHVMVPLRFPDPEESKSWRPTSVGDVLPIRTHLLTHLDDPVEIVRRYVLPNSRLGDVVTIGESPIAIMQGRFHHPATVKPGWLARRLCYLFMPTSSLATACGLQTLIDISGAWRVGFAFAVGALAKVFGKPGVFYQLAGDQARLIDDVTGTIPPYDQFIVLGPMDSQTVVNRIQSETGLPAAIVDVNDLGAVKVLAASSGVSIPFLKQALGKNPAGNANEQTPIVLIRPIPSGEN
jgi:hypothetical protein